MEDYFSNELFEFTLKKNEAKKEIIRTIKQKDEDFSLDIMLKTDHFDTNGFGAHRCDHYSTHLSRRYSEEFDPNWVPRTHGSWSNKLNKVKKVNN